MRTKEGLKDIEDITILLQYLYMDENHKIVIKNSIGVPLELYMNDDFEIGCRNLNFPSVPPMDWRSESHPSNLIGIIYGLKKEPAKEFPERFKNRWEEIKTITLSNMTLNFK